MSKKYIESDFLTGIESVLAGRLSFSAWFIPAATMILIVILLFWAWFSEVDVVSQATGEIAPTQRAQLIQPKEVGIVSEIKVRSGDQVSAGQLLVVLDGSTIEADLEQVRQEIKQLRIQSVGLMAMQKCLDDRNMCSQAFKINSKLDYALQKRAKSLYDVQRLQYYSQVRVRKARLDVARKERVLTGQKIKDFEEMLPFYTMRESRLKGLQKENLTAKSRVEESEEKRLVQEQQILQSKLEFARMVAKEYVSEEELEVYQREYKEQIYSQLFENTAQLEIKEKVLLNLKSQLKKKNLVSPIDGQVYDVNVVTLGGVVQSGEVLMKIVPSDAKLEVLVKIANKDVGFIQEGDEVKVKLDAYNFTKYGSISGVVSHISDAAVLDEQLGAVYPATVSIDQWDIKVDGNKAVIIPGMTAVVDIYQGKRLLAEYVFTPLLRYKNEALRER
jgi:HlyD family type I secretion membrane fusion protein